MKREIKAWNVLLLLHTIPPDSGSLHSNSKMGASSERRAKYGDGADSWRGWGGREPLPGPQTKREDLPPNHSRMEVFKHHLNELLPKELNYHLQPIPLLKINEFTSFQDGALHLFCHEKKL